MERIELACATDRGKALVLPVWLDDRSAIAQSWTVRRTGPDSIEVLGDELGLVLNQQAIVCPEWIAPLSAVVGLPYFKLAARDVFDVLRGRTGWLMFSTDRADCEWRRVVGANGAGTVSAAELAEMAARREDRLRLLIECRGSDELRRQINEAVEALKQASEVPPANVGVEVEMGGPEGVTVRMHGIPPDGLRAALDALHATFLAGKA